MTVPSATSRTNEAAERLRDTLGGARQQWLDAALSEERRLTVDTARRIFAAQMTNPDARWCSADEIAAVLDLTLEEGGSR